MQDPRSSTTALPFAESMAASKIAEATEVTIYATGRSDPTGAIDPSSSAQRSLAESFVMRRLAPAMAKIEIHSIRLVSRAIDKTLATAGNTLVHIGKRCMDVGERAAARGNTSTPGAES
jgi:hypothetical protein